MSVNTQWFRVVIATRLHLALDLSPHLNYYLGTVVPSQCFVHHHTHTSFTIQSILLSLYTNRSPQFSYSTNHAPMSNHPTPLATNNQHHDMSDPQAPTEIDQLTSHLASTTLTQSQNGQWIYFPPGTSLDEQLLILAGVEDYHISGNTSEIFNDAEIRRANASVAANNDNEKKNPDFAQLETVKDAMDTHLSMLTDAELAMMMQNSLSIKPQAEPSAHSPPPAPLPPISSCPPGSLPELQQQYQQALVAATTPQDLAHAPLPSDISELEQLSIFMARQVAAWVGRGNTIVFSPLAHPNYPLWLPSGCDYGK